MFWTEPARLASKFCAVVRFSAPIPGKVEVVIGGDTVPTPSSAEGRVVWVFPLFRDCELVRSISNPNLSEWEPLAQLIESLNCLNGLTVTRGAETFIPAYKPEAPRLPASVPRLP